MEMNRRRFIHRVTAAVSAMVIGVRWLREKAGSRRFVRARGPGKYPGPVRDLPDICGESEWSG
jgi:hypothetical protein